MNLQDWCRRAIIKAVGLQHIKDITPENLPLPWFLQPYISLIQLKTDFDFSDRYEDYHSTFMSHQQHDSHQVHPARCKINGQLYLVSLYRTPAQCDRCSTHGTALSQEEMQMWIEIQSNHVTRCVAHGWDETLKWDFYVLEFIDPSFNDIPFENNTENNMLLKHSFKEVTVWKLISNTIEMILDLYANNILYWPKAASVFMDKHGNIQLENGLLFAACAKKLGECSHVSNTPEQTLSHHIFTSAQTSATAQLCSEISTGHRCTENLGLPHVGAIAIDFINKSNISLGKLEQYDHAGLDERSISQYLQSQRCYNGFLSVNLCTFIQRCFDDLNYSAHHLKVFLEYSKDQSSTGTHSTPHLQL